MDAVTYTEDPSYYFHKDFKEKLQDMRKPNIKFGVVNPENASSAHI